MILILLKTFFRGFLKRDSVGGMDNKFHLNFHFLISSYSIFILFQCISGKSFKNINIVPDKRVFLLTSMLTSIAYRQHPRNDLWIRAPHIGGGHATNPGFGTPYIGHTPMPSVVNNIFLRYRQNIFCLILSIYWINRFLKVTHC